MYQQLLRHSVLMLLVAVVTPTCAVVTLAATQQVPTEAPVPPEFETASIKPNRSGVAVLGISDPTREGWQSATPIFVRSLRVAFQIRQDVDLIGGPRWIEIERFDIAATAPEKTNRDQVLVMLQSLWFQRFNLGVHREPRQTQVYKLRITNSTPKLRELKAGMTPRSAGPDTRVIGIMGKTSGLARALSKLLGRDVVDETGLTGSYDLYDGSGER